MPSRPEMPKVRLSNLDLTVSRLGFGCASLGSRVSPVNGARALALAFDHGVDWYDVAPAYGDGQAERLLGEFARSRRGKIRVCTKVGIEPAGRSRALGLLRPWARAAVQAAPALRGLARQRPTARRLMLTGSLIAESLERSLGRLGVERIELLALHDPDPDDLGREDVLIALDAAVSSGKVRTVGLAGDAGAARNAIAQTSMLKVVQIAANPLRREIQAMGDLASRPDFITHSAFGGPGFPQRLARIISADPVLANLATELGYKERDTIDAAAMLTDYALALNPHGVVLMSMFRNDHLLANVARAAQPSNGEIVQLLERALPGLCGL